ncbi:glycosyltransferase family 2 protein [Rhizobium sp. RAF56]|uniref:glycosyltransferase family 2 protein n=1 Tax=Rhizobium sp. RAF56 TaxID=3233062 RepID=UPI003F951591
MAVLTSEFQDQGRERMSTSWDETRPLALVIVTYNSSEVLPGLLDSLMAGLEGVEDFEVVVADNASADRSVDIALAHPIGARVVQTGRNAGYSGGINAATDTIAIHKNILILNPDVRLYPGAARVLNERLRDPSIGIVAPQIIEEDGSIHRSLRREPSITTAWADALLGTKIAIRLGLSEIVEDATTLEKGGSVEWAVGAVLAISARVRQAVGDWDESFFLYSEEVDYQERVRRRGFTICYTVSAKATHIGGDITENPTLCSLMSANRIRYFQRRHGRFATGLFRLAAIVSGIMRSPLGLRHRAALRGALTA